MTRSRATLNHACRPARVTSIALRGRANTLNCLALYQSPDLGRERAPRHARAPRHRLSKSVPSKLQTPALQALARVAAAPGPNFGPKRGKGRRLAAGLGSRPRRRLDRRPGEPLAAATIPLAPVATAGGVKPARASALRPPGGEKSRTSPENPRFSWPALTQPWPPMGQIFLGLFQRSILSQCAWGLYA
jgi:hypothetical protein